MKKKKDKKEEPFAAVPHIWDTPEYYSIIGLLVGSCKDLCARGQGAFDSNKAPSEQSTSFYELEATVRAVSNIVGIILAAHPQFEKYVRSDLEKLPSGERFVVLMEGALKLLKEKEAWLQVVQQQEMLFAAHLHGREN